MVCKKCGGKVKYINSAVSDDIIIVDDTLVTIITNTGRQARGYLRHQCKDGVDAQKEKG